MGDATPRSCSPYKETGPCDAFDIFPHELVQYDAENVPTGKSLGELYGFGRLHGMLADPLNLYVTASFFTPGGAFLGIIDTNTREAISLYRLTKFDTSKERSVHMSVWLEDGSAIIATNLHGKAVERINIVRDDSGKIVSTEFDKGGTFGLGTDNTVLEDGTYFQGLNAFGRPLMGSIVGEYSETALGDLTPNGFCKEDGCPDGSQLLPTGRVNNVPICPIPSTNNNLYVNFGGGGMLVLDPKTTPMTVLGEYDSTTFNGAGCGGVQVGPQMFLNSGISAGGAGFEQSTFSLYSFDDEAFGRNVNFAPPNTPSPEVVFKDPTNTNTIGNVDGVDATNNSGQIPGITTRRDAHGMIKTLDQSYIHQFDRLRNVVEVFDVESHERILTYDLTSRDGQSGRYGDAGGCLAKSVTDDPNLVGNDPSPDLLGQSPDGHYIFVGLRGPAPVSVPHSGQGSCPGVGIIRLSTNGKRGKLVDVLRTTNTIDTAPLPPITGGIQYTGAERSDIHSAIVVAP